MKKRYLIVLVVLVILLIPFIFFVKNRYKDPYQFKGNILYYSEDRQTNYEVLSKQENNSIELYKIKFQSKNFLEEKTEIYGLLFIPQNLQRQNKENAPGIVFLPAGGGTKESREEIAVKIAKLGYAILTIDQRGIGETGGTYLGIEQDYQIFLQGKEPIQHLSVYDVLKAYNVLREFKDERINKEKIGLVGESMGARYGIIAAAIDKRIKGVIVISSAGFHININPLQQENDYLVSIDPDHYIARISPNFIMMLHGTNDTVTPLADAQITFSKAKEPKRFFIAECSHGYCEEMWDELKNGLEEMFGK